MRTSKIIAFICFVVSLMVSAACVANAQDAPIQVMVVGVYHMNNPGRDLHDVRADDILGPRRQNEIAAVNAALATFHPTKVALEVMPDWVDDNYPKFLDHSLTPTADERVQLGLRLASTSGARVYGINAWTDFPYPALQAYADNNGFGSLLAEQDEIIARETAETERQAAEGGVAAALRYINSPARILEDNSVYRSVLRIGAGKDQPGVELLAAWQKRNLLICANLLQMSKPGDRIVVFYGGGHAYLLRQCVIETPGFALIEPYSYLPADKTTGY